MIQTYSQRMTPPFSGQAQIAESDRARAISLDGQTWEIHFFKETMSPDGSGYDKLQRRFFRVANIKNYWIRQVVEDQDSDFSDVDERILELARFLATATLPFPPADHYEYWLLDARQQTPLAFIFSCKEEAQKKSFPKHPEWTALPASIMPVEKLPEEIERGDPPVNAQLESLVLARAGYSPKAAWFDRSTHSADDFPQLLVTEDWEEESARNLCQRYLERQSPRLLMLHGLQFETRRMLEQASREQVQEAARFYPVYPEIVDPKIMDTIRVEAHMRSLVEKDPTKNRLDGVFYF